MKNFIVLFREPDGRQNTHSEEEISKHRDNWKDWMETYGTKGNLAGGSPLTLKGVTIDVNKKVVKDIYKAGTEIIGGFLLLKAENIEDAIAIISSCPIFDFEASAEIREYQQQ
ncbi:YciI family protein [Solitalea sp. MAHUQ-68]|uniref:YciI family protein n=1 Tax=Solitalea agri TaxID=2953739 RepID=A0A9X2F9R1_9SPHI|nr:YciI family protein [Solitalea agri]MCO4293038.1 YciI family protein [Solitalea agri]